MLFFYLLYDVYSDVMFSINVVSIIHKSQDLFRCSVSPCSISLQKVLWSDCFLDLTNFLSVV